MHLKENEAFIYVCGKTQILYLISKQKTTTYHISTAKNGFGEQKDSFKTPRGWHYIRFIIGRGNPCNTGYIRRRVTLKKSEISSRILWLQGLTPKQNKYGHQDSLRRYIYIHGTPNTFLKRPISKGCINMRNQDIAALTQQIPQYCKVLIQEC
ncbi:L,D-transpeptidase [Candidatus Comchoanobacter bicostacola]|uniref:L,D-transpeptidase n=1 Tax=Candidatus Comchoanobacter bicostacola TaxID=2919598 RepID=A0ABY5DL87_9GAMM|nr:L,D-transpeptidase [Candidatus Comchoanobacter bicostacola]UTC24890.1 L,D-transpeptidase [Candidatus Comchoanobacter bicostacola]